MWNQQWYPPGGMQSPAHGQYFFGNFPPPHPGQNQAQQQFIPYNQGQQMPQGEMGQYPLVHPPVQHYNNGQPFPTFQPQPPVGIPHQHPQTHASSMFYCSPCRVYFQTAETYHEHKRSIHYHSMPFRCDLCPAVFREMSQLQFHLANLHTDTLHGLYNAGPVITSQNAAGIGFESFSSPQDEGSLVYNGNCYTCLGADKGEHLEELRAMLHDEETLLREQHVLKELSDEEIDLRRKCKICKSAYATSAANPICKIHSGRPVKSFELNSTYNILMSCCGKSRYSSGCTVIGDGHVFDSLETAKRDLSFVRTPAADPLTKSQKFDAVVIDCEMGRDRHNKMILIQLVAIDYISCRVLINQLVRPREHIHNFNTQYSGVTAADMAAAIARGNVIDGWENARKRLWDFIDSDTVLIGHGIKNDLAQLRVIHEKIVDTYIVIPRLKTESQSLKNLSKVLLDKSVQRGNSGHNCLEDALATRELVIWAIKNKDGLLAARREKAQREAEMDRIQCEEREAFRQKVLEAQKATDDLKKVAGNFEAVKFKSDKIKDSKPTTPVESTQTIRKAFSDGALGPVKEALLPPMADNKDFMLNSNNLVRTSSETSNISSAAESTASSCFSEDIIMQVPKDCNIVETTTVPIAIKENARTYSQVLAGAARGPPVAKNANVSSVGQVVRKDKR